MKAVFQDRFGSADVLRVREVEKPVLADDRVLVRVRAASVNALVWHLLRGKPFLVRLLEGMRKPKKPVRGVDVAGTVDAVGKSVTRWKPGDEVSGTATGSFAEHTSAAKGKLARKPSNVTFEQAPAVPIAALSALEALRDKGPVKPGQRVLICGAGGGVGSFAVQIATSLDAQVTAVTSTGNMDMVRSIGADPVIDYTKEDSSRRGERYDLLVDFSGNRSRAGCRRVLTPKGTLVLVGSMKDGVGGLLWAMLIRRFVSNRLATFIAKGGEEDLVRLADLLESGKLSPVIDRHFPLAEAPLAIR